jgi:hypothetical protein
MLKRFFQFALSNSVFIAFCAMAMVMQTLQLFAMPENYPLVIFVFFATIGSYNFYWLISILSSGKKNSFRNILTGSMFLIMIVIGIAGMLLTVVYLENFYFHFLVSIILISLYSFPVLRFKRLNFFRYIGFLKTIILAFAWMYVTGFIPLQKNLNQLNYPEYLFLTGRFIFIFILSIIFDNRDVHVDKLNGLYSLATHLEAKRLKLLVYLLFICWILANYFLGIQSGEIKNSIALQCTTMVTLIVFYFSLRKQGYLFYYFFVDGLMILSFILTSLASI